MKTDFRIQNWLRCAVIMFLAVAGSLTTSAQEVEGGEAFYIYQNDGHFDGFFYDQVKEIRYSRFDTLGIERSEYLSQEIVTEDSVYRIMLTAIDSVSFVQPEIKFAKNLRFIAEDGLMNYFLRYVHDESSGHVLVFSTSMPESLKPKVGEVLFCDSVPGYVDGAFVYKVNEIHEDGNQLLAKFEYITDYRDVFEQFITVDQVRNVKTPEGSRTHRRLAGYKPPKKIEGNIEEFTLFNINTGFSAKHNFYGTLGLEFAANINFGVNLSSVYNISLTNWYFKHEVKAQFGVGASLGLDGELSKDIDFSSIPATTMALVVPKRIPVPSPPYPPIFYARAAPEPAVHIEAHLNVKLNTGFKAFAVLQRIESLNTFPYVDVKLRNIAPFLDIPNGWDAQKEWSINAQLNGSFQGGVKFPIEVGAQPWLEKILALKTGVQVLCGPKVTGVLDLSMLTNGSEGFFSATRPRGTYNLLKGSKVDLSLFSIDPQFTATVKTFGVNWDYKHVSSLSFGNFTLHLFPTIKDLSYEVTGEQQNIIKARCGHIEGETFLPERIGFGLYKQKDENDKEFSELYRYVTRNETYLINTYNGFELTMEDVSPGVYKAIPVIWSPIGVVAVETDEQIITISSQELELKPNTITAEEEGGKFEVEILVSLGQEVRAFCNDDWIEAEVKYNVGSMKATIMYVTVKENDTDKFRKSSITVTQQLKDGRLVEKELVVKQYGGLQLDPTSVNFIAAGEEKEIDVLTSYKPITINLHDADKWLSEVYLDDERKLYLTAAKNEGAPRSAKVTVAGWSSKHNGISTIDLLVTQDGPVDVTIDPDELEFEANGLTKTVNLTMGGNYAFTGIELSDEDKEWIACEKLTSSVNVTAMPNTTPVERIGYVNLLFRKSKTSAPGPDTFTLTVKVKQKASIAKVEPDELRFSANGGSKKVKIDFGLYPYCGAYVSEEGEDWCKYNVGSDGTVTVTVGENPSILNRECNLVCYVSGKLKPEDGDMQKMNVHVVQEGMQIEPDGDNSPIKQIVFFVQRKCNLISDETPTDSIFDTGVTFAFKPENSQFRYSISKGVTHYDLQGFINNDFDTRGDVHTAHLSFDVSKEGKVSNLVFNGHVKQWFDMTVPGVATSHTVINSTSSITVGQFPLDLNGYTYKMSKQPLSVADGLTFGTFSVNTHTLTTYTPSALNPEPIAPVSAQNSMYPVGDSSDCIYLIISLKESLEGIEWPSNEVINSLKAGGMPISAGSTPPNVEGTYILSPISVVSNHWEEPVSTDGVSGMVVKFSDQKDGQLTFDFYSIYGGEVDEATGGMKALVKGEGNNFTVCAPMGGEYFILSGTVENGSVTNLHMATATDKPGTYFIMKDNDGSSAKTGWSPAPPED